VLYTWYPASTTPPHYIPGHAAFEMGFHEDGLWPWLAAQSLPSRAVPVFAASLVASCVLMAMACRCGAPSRARLARIVSTVALVASALAMLGLMQSEGGLLDSCYSYSFFDVSTEKCREIGANVVKAGRVRYTQQTHVPRRVASPLSRARPQRAPQPRRP
jgi:hypothetical protein